METHHSKTVAVLVNNPATHDARIFRIAETLRANGYSVTIIGTHKNGLAPEETRQGIRILRVGHLRLLRKFMRPRKATASAQNDSSRLNASVLGFFQVLARHMRYLFVLGWFLHINLQMFRVLIRERPAICHANDFDTLMAGFFYARKTGGKLLYDTHELFVEQDPDYPRWWKVLLSKFERRGFLQADAVTTINRSIRNELFHRYGGRPMEIIYNAQRKKTVLPHSPIHTPIRLLYHGIIGPNRGLRETLKALQQLPTIQFIIRGSGDTETYKRLVASLGVSARVTFSPPVAPDQVIAAAHEADIGIIPYQPTCLNNYFSLPNKFFEYISAGLAIVATDIPELHSFIIANSIGDLFQPSSPSSLAKTLQHLIQNPGRIEAMKSRSHVLATTRLNWENEEKKLLGLYSAFHA